MIISQVSCGQFCEFSALYGHDPIHVAGEFQVMGGNQRRYFARANRFFQSFKHLFGRIGIKISRRLIGQQQFRTVYQSPGYRNPLLLPTRKFARPMRSTVRHPHQCQDIGDALPDFPTLFSPQQQGERHVLFDGQTGNEMESLEDDAYRVTTGPRPIV